MHVNKLTCRARLEGKCFRRCSGTGPTTLTNFGALEKCSNLDRLPWDLAGKLIILFGSELTAYLCHWALHLVRRRAFMIVGIIWASWALRRWSTRSTSPPPFWTANQVHYLVLYLASDEWHALSIRIFCIWRRLSSRKAVEGEEECVKRWWWWWI